MVLIAYILLAESPEARKDKWKDLGTQILCSNNSHD